MPTVVDLWDAQQPEVECVSVHISVTVVRHDGALEADLARYVWYFGQGAVNGPRPSHLPLYLQQHFHPTEVGSEREGAISVPELSLRAGSQSPPPRSPHGSDHHVSLKQNGSHRSSKLKTSILKATKWVSATPPGAGIPEAFAPQPYVEAAPFTYDESFISSYGATDHHDVSYSASDLSKFASQEKLPATTSRNNSSSGG